MQQLYVEHMYFTYSLVGPKSFNRSDNQSLLDYHSIRRDAHFLQRNLQQVVGSLLSPYALLAASLFHSCAVAAVSSRGAPHGAQWGR